MSLFNDIMERFPSDFQEKVNKRIHDWSKKNPFGQRVARNIKDENFLHCDSMEALLSFIGSFAPKNTVSEWEEFEKQYQQLCYIHALQGCRLTTDAQVRYFGTSIEKEIFLQHLNDTKVDTGLYSDKAREDFIFRLTQGRLQPHVDFLRLKKYSVWSTWNMESPNDFPFDFCRTNCAEEVRVCMGLRIDDAKTDLLIFVYELPLGIEPKKATIADAELNEYFEPPTLKDAPFTTTITWKFSQKYKSLGYYLDPRPECVHDSITLKNIVLPIKIKS